MFGGGDDGERREQLIDMKEEEKKESFFSLLVPLSSSRICCPSLMFREKMMCENESVIKFFSFFLILFLSSILMKCVEGLEQVRYYYGEVFGSLYNR